MSIDGSGNVNVFFSSPRVSFGEPPNHTHSILPCTTSSLLTFADMVLALDNKHVLEADAIESSCGYLGKGDSDHTYASNGYIRTTRSQTAKAAAQLEHQMAHEKEMPDKTKNEKYDAFLRKPLKYSSNSEANQSDNNELLFKTKRCSSVENLNSTVTKHSIKIEVESANAVSRTCEWPNAFLKNSPRKSSSFEEVSFDTNKSSIKISKSTESVQRASASFTLHRLVNDTLEFPCWPRKADHTYATATWDGTAASHCLFEQEMSKDNISEDHEMEVVDHDYVSQQLNHSREPPISEQLQSMHNVFLQKEDHTYVKPKNISCSPEASEIVVSTQESIERPYFSSATFPRQKMRDDHTYFQSGLSRKNCGSDATRDWSSAQNVADMFTSEDKYIEEAYKSLQSSTQSSYAKKDHNYSTST
ncbi:hypothetical protein BgiMline_022300 [Biomphalaria glabrata]|uniref:Uncharacterized protein n=1 Tax=Biomphalaria glabrata TaxID=6526 RepID=A0A2C9L9P5_BIOGL|nr:hypothetical protein BgiMline_010178 [Biomphalaria glabrata]KAI8798035.1 hypothetical protein BgiBS90_000338 [Biomphalaria glabrata]